MQKRRRDILTKNNNIIYTNKNGNFSIANSVVVPVHSAILSFARGRRTLAF